MLSGALLSFALANLKHDAEAVFAWLSHRSFWQLMFGAALILAGWEYIGKRAEQRHAHKVETQLSKCTTGRKADRDAYAKAQSDAAAANKAHVQAENQLREQINEASRNSFTADRDRLRAQSGAPKGAAGAAGIPQVSKPAPGTPPEVLSLPPAELLRAQELELQLNSLIDWVLRQSKVRQTGAPSSSEPQQDPLLSHRS